jgi:hypothetical protein
MRENLRRALRNDQDHVRLPQQAFCQQSKSLSDQPVEGLCMFAVTEQEWVTDRDACSLP